MTQKSIIKRKYTKRALVSLLILMIALAFMPMTAFADKTAGPDPQDSNCTLIKNTMSTAEKLQFNTRIQLGENSIGERFIPTSSTPSPDYHYFNVDLWYEFTITTESEITILGEAHKRESDRKNYNQIWYYMMSQNGKQAYPDIDRKWLGNGGIRAGTEDDQPFQTTNKWKLLPGKYYIYFQPANANNDYGWITVTAKATQSDFGGELNDTISQAKEKKAIKANTTYKGSLNYWGKSGSGSYDRDEHDYYKFIVPSDNYKVKLTASTDKKNNFSVALEDANGYKANSYVEVKLETKASGSVTYTGLKKGTYYVHIDGWPANAYEAEYSFRLEAPSPLPTPKGLKLTGTKASWGNVANNNGYILKILSGSKVIKTVKLAKNKTSFSVPKKYIKQSAKYKISLIAKGTGKYCNSKTATLII